MINISSAIKNSWHLCKFEFDREQYKKLKVEEKNKGNIFNLSMEMGPNTDENIASTIMGIAIKNGENWRIYDKESKEIIDIGNMPIESLPICIIPTVELKEGDLIKDGGEYYFVLKVNKRFTKTLCARTGEIKNIIPIKNILGVSCYSKVIDFNDFIRLS